MWWVLAMLACTKSEPATESEDTRTPESAPPDSAPLHTWHADADRDGYGDPNDSVQADAAPSGYVDNATDCDDTRADVYPNAPETCDQTDQDCDGLVDEDALDLATWYADQDADGYGDPAQPMTACAPPSGHVGDDTDCDDASPEVFPTAPELCADGLDQDCDGVDIRCRPEGSLSLADAEAVFYGQEEGDYAGHHARMGGDTNGDGLAELLISASQEGSTNNEAPGRAFLISAPTVGEELLGETGQVIVGQGEDIHVWWAQFLQDIDGDGYDEMFVESSGFGCILRGPLDSDHTLSDADPCIVPEGRSFADAVSVGDQNGDGLGDFVVSSTGDMQYSNGLGYNVGRGYLLLGPATSVTDITQADGRLLPYYGNDDGRFGDTLCSGDINADGIPDIVVGAPAGYGTLPTWRRGGLVYVVLGPLSGDLFLDDGQGNATGADGLWRGMASGAYAGAALSCGDDVNSDGKDDVLVGAFYSGVGLGVAYLLLNPLQATRALDEADWIVEGVGDDVGLGRGVNLDSDLDSDGRADLFVAAGGATAEDHVYLWYGDSMSGVTDSRSAEARWSSEAADDGAWQLAGGADLDGDGFQDLLVGAYGYDSADASMVGATYIIYGGGAVSP